MLAYRVRERNKKNATRETRATYEKKYETNKNKRFAVWDIFPFKKIPGTMVIISFDEEAQKTRQGRHRQSNRTSKSPSQRKKASRETLPLVHLVEYASILYQQVQEQHSWYIRIYCCLYIFHTCIIRFDIPPCGTDDWGRSRRANT